MKGDVATAPLPIVAEARSPMINIPAGIVKEFMSSDSSDSDKSTKAAMVDGRLAETGSAIDGEFAGKRAFPISSTVNGTNYLPNGVLAASRANSATPPLLASIKPVSNGALTLMGSTTVTSIGTIPVNSTKNTLSSMNKTNTSTVTNMDTAPVSLRNYRSLEAPSLLSLDIDPLSSGLDASLTPLTPLANITPLASNSSTLTPLTNSSSMSLTPLVPLTNNSMTVLSSDVLPSTSELIELLPVTNTISSSHINSKTHNNNNNQTQILDVRKNTEGKENTAVGEMNGLKRSLCNTDDAACDPKKQRLSPSPLVIDDSKQVPQKKVETKKPPKEDNILLIDEEVESLKRTAHKLHRFKRKELERIILELFMGKLLHDHELGKYKSMCEKLEATLESNRKKTAQFHKEIDDLRKVTKRLREEHIARKDQLVTPIKIKRSVGIQAAPHIIQRGLSSIPGLSKPPLHPTNATFQLPGSVIGSPLAAALAPTGQVLLLNNPNGIPNGGVGGSPGGPHQNQVLRTSAGGVKLGMVGNTGPGLPVLPVLPYPPTEKRSYFLAQPIVAQNIGSPSSAPVASSGSAVIDLTDEEEGRSPATKPGPLKSSTQSFSAVPASSTPPSSTALPSRLLNTSRPLTTSPGVAPAPPAASSQQNAYHPGPLSRTAPQQAVGGAKPPAANHHPAPLPRTAPQQVVGGAKQLPPQPTLKLSHKENSIVLSWTMAKTLEHEAIASYQLYAYQESSQSPSPNLWKKVGSVKALELPMACTLTQFMPGHRYHFAVRAVDAKSRLGQFSEPRSIHLEKLLQR